MEPLTKFTMHRQLVIFFVFNILILTPLLAQSQANQYKLGAGDMVRIQVYDEDDLYLEARVSDSGTISYPFLGELKVAGVTPTGLERQITESLVI